MSSKQCSCYYFCFSFLNSRLFFKILVLREVFRTAHKHLGEGNRVTHCFSTFVEPITSGEPKDVCKHQAHKATQYKVMESMYAQGKHWYDHKLSRYNWSQEGEDQKKWIRRKKEEKGPGHLVLNIHLCYLP
uniref:Uncharacterized protein n=1 Tax=Anolis carolinensis TaxID=28377 RepID=A0A803T0R2_ANOCA